MKKKLLKWNFLYFLIISLYSTKAITEHISRTWVQISLLYYKNFTAQTIKNNVPVPGCVLKITSDQPVKILWHCREKAYLLRPLSQVISLHNKPYDFKLNSTEFNLNHTTAQIVSMRLVKKPLALSIHDFVPVTGIFITHSFKVKSYQFKNVRTGHISEIKATWDHPFYAENSGSFIPISSLSSTDHLINNKHEAMQLLCPANRKIHCGIRVHSLPPAQVYNLETYRKHTFYAGSDKIFVHNCDVSASFLPLNNHIYYTVERAGGKLREDDKELLEGKNKLSKISAQIMLDHTRNAKYLNHDKIAYYMFHGADSESFPEGVLFKDNSKSISGDKALVKQSPQEIVDTMRKAKEYAEAETLFIINCAPGTQAETEARGFSQYFQSIRDITGKHVISNRRNKLLAMTIKDINDMPVTIIGGKNELSTCLGGPEYIYDSFPDNQFVVNLSDRF